MRNTSKRRSRFSSAPTVPMLCAASSQGLSMNFQNPPWPRARSLFSSEYPWRARGLAAVTSMISGSPSICWNRSIETAGSMGILGSSTG